MNRQQFEKALGKFQRACILDPETDTGCLNVGIAFLNMQRFDEARTILEKSAQRDPQNPRVWFNLGLLEKASGNAPAAIADFQKVAALDSYDADTQYFLGLIYSQQQEYDKAIVAFRKAIALNPFQVSAEFGLAQALQRSNDTAQAKIHFDKFQHLTTEKLGKPISFIYGEQGKYSLAGTTATGTRTGAAGHACSFCERDRLVGAAHAFWRRGGGGHPAQCGLRPLFSINEEHVAAKHDENAADASAKKGEARFAGEIPGQRRVHH